MNSDEASPQPIPVHRIAIPNPFFEGNTNVYLLDTDPLTLIDTGIGTDEAFETLKTGFQAAGQQIESLKRIILTHKHQDHFGLARRLQDLTDCEVYIHSDDQYAVTHVSERLQEFEHVLRERLGGWGVPAADIDRVAVMPHRLDKLGGSTAAAAIVDGQKLPCGSTKIEVIHTPGHTVGSICLKMDDYLFTGDHVLPGYTPNIGGADLAYNGLLGRYLASLERIATHDRPGLTVLPGHDEPVQDLSAQVQETMSHHADRIADLLRRLRDNSPKTIYELSVEIFGEMHDYHLVLGTGEVHAHLELLIDSGVVAEQAGRYRAT